jgi:hypothetical protein
LPSLHVPTKSSVLKHLLAIAASISILSASFFGSLAQTIKPDLVVHVAFSGGFHYKKTLTGPYSGIDFFCVAGQAQLYTVSFDQSAMLKARGGNFKKDTFALTVQSYSPKTLHYHGLDRVQLTIVVHRHAYWSQGADVTDARLSRDGRSGRFSGRHLMPMKGFHGKPVNVSGSWSCAQLLKA